MKDAVLVLLLSLSVATVITAHVATAYGLVFHRPRWRAAVALLVPPLGVVWGHTVGMRVRPRAVLFGAIVYGVARLLA